MVFGTGWVDIDRERTSRMTVCLPDIAMVFARYSFLLSFIPCLVSGDAFPICCLLPTESGVVFRASGVSVGGVADRTLC